MTGTAVVARETGEILEVRPGFDLTDYLTTVGSAVAIKQQHQLAAAYDAACASLIGPNDVQVEGGRTFKKKSAWRKLGRHFSISTAVVSVHKEWMDETFVATVTVRASAPWGQSAEAVGACGTDEESGRREITMADAIATAETRATNRAISNLIAMGEVSAEEMSKGEPRASGPKAARDKVMPFGKTKGKKLGELETKELDSTAKWCREKDATKFADLIAAIDTVIAERNNPVLLDQMPPALEDQSDDLPF